MNIAKDGPVFICIVLFSQPLADEVKHLSVILVGHREVGVALDAYFWQMNNRDISALLLAFILETHASNMTAMIHIPLRK